jgi:hypothetical protein
MSCISGSNKAAETLEKKARYHGKLPRGRFNGQDEIKRAQESKNDKVSWEKIHKVSFSVIFYNFSVHRTNFGCIRQQLL